MCRASQQNSSATASLPHFAAIELRRRTASMRVRCLFQRRWLAPCRLKQSQALGGTPGQVQGVEHAHAHHTAVAASASPHLTWRGCDCTAKRPSSPSQLPAAPPNASPRPFQSVNTSKTRPCSQFCQSQIAPLSVPVLCLRRRFTRPTGRAHHHHRIICFVLKHCL